MQFHACDKVTVSMSACCAPQHNVATLVCVCVNTSVCVCKDIIKALLKLDISIYGSVQKCPVATVLLWLGRSLLFIAMFYPRMVPMANNGRQCCLICC